MNHQSIKFSLNQESRLRSDRSIWLAVASIVSSCALITSAGAATVTEDGATAPTANVLLQQLSYATPLGGGWGGGQTHPTEDYTDNGGPPGQTFTLGSSATVTALSVMGGGDAGGSGTTVSLQFGTVDGTGAMSALSTETFNWGTISSSSDWFTFTLTTPLNLNSGTQYYWSLASAGSWFGLAHSTSDVLAGGYGFDSGPNNTPINPTGLFAPSGGTGNTFGPFAKPLGDRSAAGAQFGVNPDYTFELIGTTVPEPGSAALLGLGGLATVIAHRRRRA